MAHMGSRNVQPGVREDPRLVRESVESSRASMTMGRSSVAYSRPSSSSSVAATGYGPRSSVGAVPSTGGAGGSDWVLDPISWEGRTYLLDRRTGAVYADTPEDQYPEMVGRWQDNRVVLRSRNVVVDLFANLDKYLRENKVKFRDLFNSFDSDCSGTLELGELGQLVSQLVPGVTVSELKYIMAMLDSSGDGAVSEAEFLAAAKASLDAAKRLQAERAAGGSGASSDVQVVLRRVTDYLRSNRESASAAFSRHDVNGNGRLEPRELLRFFAQAVPGLGEDQRRYLLAHMAELDANGDGTVSFAELLHALRAAEVTRGSQHQQQQVAVAAAQPPQQPPVMRPSTSFRRGSNGAGGSDWVLDPISWEGRTYLLDRRTGAVYADTPEDQYPEMVGRWQDNRVVLRSRNVVVDLFANLDKYLRENKVKFRDLFNSFDTDCSGTLELAELGQLVSQLVPGVTVSELKYIMAMLDSSGDGAVSETEFLAAAKASLDAAKRLQAERAAAAGGGGGGAAAGGGAGSDVQVVLRRVTDYLRSNRESASAAFSRHDVNGNGRLEPRELLRFFTQAVPGLGEDQRRYLLAHMAELDANGDGTVSFAELLHALRAAEVTRGSQQQQQQQAVAVASQPSLARGSSMSLGRPPLARQASIAAMPGGAEWVLEDVYDPNTGRQLKRDPATGLVYQEVTPGEWPQVVGVQDASGVLRLTQRRDDGGLFAALDEYLRKNRVKFRDMFEHFDADRSGQLDMGELRQLVATILPGFSEGQLHYFQSLLDINGDGGISFEEMMEVAKVCLAAERAAAAGGGGREPHVKSALDRFQAYLLQYSTIALQHFEAADPSRRGYLLFPEFAHFLHNLMPDLQEPQRRGILSYLYAQDVDQSGVISWLMLARFMRLPQLAQLAPATPQQQQQLLSPGGGMGSRGSSNSGYGQVMGAAPGQGQPSLRRMGTSPHRVTFEGDSWQVEEVVWRGEVFLMDPHTKRIYRQDQPGEWPRLVGVYRDGTVVIQERPMASALFETLDAYLKQHRMRCKEVFSHFDSGSKGWLTPEELGQLVGHFLPGGQVTPGDSKYFQVMVDRNGDGRITYDEFLEAARSCRAEEAATRDRTADVSLALQTVSDFVRNHGVEMRSAFSRFDTNRNGLLEPREVARLLRAAVQPPLDDQQLRYAMAHLHAYDMDGDGCLSYREFCIAMRAVDARARASGGREDRVLRGGFLAGPQSAAAAVAGMRPSLTSTAAAAARPRSSRGSATSFDGVEPEGEWVLQEFPYNGQMLLLDPRTRRVYHSPDGRSWPQLLGKLENGRVTRAAELRPNDLWTRVDAYLRSNRVKLQELFTSYDTDRSGSLRPSELGRLIRDMLPDVQRAELHYFLAMMDANGDGAVSYDEFLSAARDSLRATQQLSSGGSGGGGSGGSGGGGFSFPSDVLSVLEQLSGILAEQPLQARRVFESCDKNNDGSLNLSEVSRFLRSLLPDLGGRQLQYVLSYLAALDLDGDGQLRFSELMAGLHALQPRGPNGATYSRSFLGSGNSSGVSSGVRALVASASATNRSSHERANAEMLGRGNPAAYTRDWELHEWRYRGTTYLLDPATGLVYGDVASAEEWPQLLGRKVGEVLQPLDSSATITFFRNLDAHLKSEQVKFSALFSEFDRGRKGYLERSELAGLVRRVMPEATEAQIRFLAVVLDENNDNVFTQSELLGAAKKVVELLRQQQQQTGAGVAAGAGAGAGAAVLDRFSRYLRENMDHARAIFESLDPHRTGYLDYDRVAQFFRQLEAAAASGGSRGPGSRGSGPRLSPEDQRCLLTQVHLYDVDGVGQVTFAELLRALHAADLRSTHGVHTTGWGRTTPGGGAGRRSALYDAPTTWRLESYRWGDRDVLLDPSSGVLYSRPRAEGDWPQPLGRLTSGPGGSRSSVTAVRPDTLSFFKRLDSFLKEQRVRLRQLFEAADTDRSGALDSGEMGRLVRRVMPEATEAQMGYLVAMLDVHGMDQVTYEQFVQVCRDCMASEAAAAAASSEGGGGGGGGGASTGLPADVAEALRRLSERLLTDRAAAVSLFRQADRDGSGRLDPREVAALLRRLVPGRLRPEELRAALVALFRNMDHNGDGTLSFQEFMYGMRAVELQTPDRTIAAGNWRSGHISTGAISPVRLSYGGGGSSALAPYREPILTSLELEEVRLGGGGGGRGGGGGGRYLLSRYNNHVYELPMAQAARAGGASAAQQPWPRVVGLYDPASNALARRLDGGTASASPASASSAALFSALDNYLRTARVRFSELFSRYDADRSGRLEPRELGRLVGDLLGPTAATPADVAYLTAMLDLDGSRSVSEQEFLSVAKEYLALERRAADVQSEEVRRALERISKYLAADKEGGYQLFLRHDTHQEGRLPLLKLPGFFTDLLRGQPLAQREMHYLLTHAHGYDIVKSGRFSYNDLLIAFRAIHVRFPGGGSSSRPGFQSGAGATTAAGGPPPAFAQLEAFQHSGSTYYRDPDTGLVYVLVDDRRLGPRLELAPFRTAPGRVYGSSGRPTVLSGPGAAAAAAGRGSGSGAVNPADRLFEALDAALKEYRVRLRDVFDRYDTNRNGLLEGRELGRLVRDLVPQAGEADVRYLLAMLDYDGDSAVSFQELVEAVRECWAAVKNRTAGGGGGGGGGGFGGGGGGGANDTLLEGLLERIGGYMRRMRESAAATFARFDVSGSGRLEPRELGRFLRACVPELSSGEIRLLMTHLHSFDLNGDGALSYTELAHALYGMELQMPDGRRIPARYVARPPAGSGSGHRASLTSSASSAISPLGTGTPRPFVELREWRLEPWHCSAEGRDYLLDRQAGTVYQLATAAAAVTATGGGGGGVGGGGGEEGVWPVLIGARTTEGRVQRLESTISFRFFEALDRKLRIERVRLDELMAEYDTDGSASLDSRELARLSSYLLGEQISGPSVKYLMALLDLDGDRRVTRGEVLEVFRQMGDAGRRIAGLQEPGVVSVLNRLSSAVSLNQRAAWERFCRADGNGSGALEPRELRWFMDSLLPRCAPSDMRLLLLFLALLDVNDSGAVEWRELLVALRVLPARTPTGLLRPPRPPFRVRRPDPEYDDNDDRGYGDEDARRLRRGSYGAYRQRRSADGDEYDEDGDAVRDSVADPAAEISDGEFAMEVRALPRSSSSSSSRRRSSSDRVTTTSAHIDTPFAHHQYQHQQQQQQQLLRDPESGLLYIPPPAAGRGGGGAVKGAWPQLAAYTDPRDGGRRSVPPLSSWRLLLDLDELVRSDPDRIPEAVEAAVTRRRSSSSMTRGSSMSRSGGGGGGGGGNETLDIRTAATVLHRVALEATGGGGGGGDGRRRGSNGGGGGTDPWVEPLLRGMLEVMHDGSVRVRKLRPDVEALAGAVRLLTNAAEGPALLREVAAGLNREYRKVVRAMRKRVLRPEGYGDEYGRDGAAGGGRIGGGAVLRLRDVRDVLQDVLPEVLGRPEPAMAALLYLLYNCPHCLTRGSASQPLALGWKDVFKALRAVKCRHPDGTSRVGVWDAEELVREPSEASTSSSETTSNSSRSSSPAAARHGGGGGGYSRRSRYDNADDGGRTTRRHHRSRHSRRDGGDHDRHRRDRDRERNRDRDRDLPYPGRYGSDGRPMPYGGPEVYDPSIYGPGYNPALYGRRGSKYGGPMYDMPLEVVTAQVAAMGLDPAAAAELQRVASINKSYSYVPAAVAAAAAAGRGMVSEDAGGGAGAAAAAAAVRQRMATDLRMSRVHSARQLNVAELARRKVHPARRTVVLESYTTPDGQKCGVDPATGLVYFQSSSPDYPDLAGKLRPSGEFTAGGGSAAPLQTVFNKLRTLDEAVLVHLFKAYDANNNGTLELKELMALLRDVTGLPYAEAGLVQALLDVDLSSTLTLKEWTEGIRASTVSLDAASGWMGGGGGGGTGGGGGSSRVQRNALTVLAAVSKQIAADLDVFWAAYARADRDGNGYLDIAELTRFFRDLFRDMPPYDVRLLVAHCFTADTEKDGLVRPDELLQHLRAIPLEAPNGIKHRPGFRVPSSGSAASNAGLMDSIRSAGPNARLSYHKGLTVEVPDISAPDPLLAAGLPSSHGFPPPQHPHQHPVPPTLHGTQSPASVFSAFPLPGAGGSVSGVGGFPPTPASLAALSAVPSYVPVPVPVPYMMPPGGGGGTASSVAGGGGSVMGYLLPYQQDMYQALLDRLTTTRTSVAGSRSSRRTSSASVVPTPRRSEAGTAYSGAGSDGTPLSSDREEEPTLAPPPPPPPYVEQPPPPYTSSRRTSYTGSDHHYGAAPAPYHAPPQQPHLYDNPSMSYDVQQSYRSVGPAAAGGNGFGAIQELQHIASTDPGTFHTHFTASARRIPISSTAAAARRSYSSSGYVAAVRQSGYTYVVPRGALGQLVHRLVPHLRERERSYIVAVLAACLPYNVTSYAEDDLLYAVRQGAAIERAVLERRLPTDVAAVAARLADGVIGNTAYGPARSVFSEADRLRRGYLPLAEAARVLTRLDAVPPTAVAWLTAGLAHYAATVLQGAGELSYRELGAALSYMSTNAVQGGAPPPYQESSTGYGDSGHPHPHTHPYPLSHQVPYNPGQHPPYSPAAPPYPEGRYPSLSSMPPGGSAAPTSSPPPYGSPPAPYDNRYPLSPQGSYNAQQPLYGSTHPYNAPPNPYGGPPSPHGGPYSGPYANPYGAPYGSSPPLSPHSSALHGAPLHHSPRAPYGSYDHSMMAGGYPTDPGVGGASTVATGLPVGSAYYMWTYDNRHAVVQKHVTDVLKGRVVELDAQKGALEKEAGLQSKILDLSNALLANETAQRDVLGLVQSYVSGGGTPPVSVADMVGRIRTTLEEAVQMARTAGGGGAGAALLQSAGGLSDELDSLLDALSNARWSGGQPVSPDTLWTVLALRRDAFALRRAHSAALMAMETRQQGLALAGQEAHQAMAIQLQLLQAQLQRQAQELQHRLTTEAAAIAAATSQQQQQLQQPHAQQPHSLPGLLLPPAHAGTAALVAGLGAATSPAAAAAAAVGNVGPQPAMVWSPRTWQLEPAVAAASSPLPWSSPSVSYVRPVSSRTPSTGGVPPAAIFPAPPRD
ncbi:hypothetical protein PLESTB_001651900 [Pleodorina starrii]|uniref:EF-hand domain-containing protein n=1 Tax=Pleodorina starrii TaxID=330485 RepID=A0A9W6BYJ4_9CHLO|nr:hypothetical protein PLESTM_000869200 [Pleodorina starrii]GLC60647.1 hypothetical protein PLESTB_001651900 [Pleodorina starrii]GLC68904.1 hypothetical protein PLESTF_000756400 [Pleodorina starrii]